MNYHYCKMTNIYGMGRAILVLEKKIWKCHDFKEMKLK